MKIRKIRAIKHIQGDREIFSLSVQGNEILDIASIDRIRRDDKGVLIGYQRIEISKHINEISEYMNRADAILPNAIVVCFDDVVKFEEIADGMGYLIIPDNNEHGWIVDGQQRATALYKADGLKNKTFNVTVNAFISSNAQVQREQFMLVNNSKPLPKTLLNELMPNTVTALPKAMEEKRLPNLIVQELNRNEHSIFFNRIKTHTCPDGYIAENSLLQGIKASLSDGFMFYYSANAVTGRKEHDVDSIISITNTYFTAVAELWSEDFNSKPKDTRLTHGVGLDALFTLLSFIEARINRNLLDYTKEDFKKILEELNINWKKMLLPVDDDTKINIMSLQNNSKDKHFFSNWINSTFREKAQNGSFK